MKQTMSTTEPNPDPAHMAAAIGGEIQALPKHNTPIMRAVARAYSRKLKTAPAAFVLELARILWMKKPIRWIAYELIRNHPEAFASLGEAELEELGQGMDSWYAVDEFARTLSGPAWLKGQAPDDLFVRWAGSNDPWWRRAALVSTVALNMRSHGGKGDVLRTLAICRLLVGDHEDMVVKAMSWALRELVVHDAPAVTAFLEQYDGVLAARVKREVRHKLATGLKNPRRKKSATT
jgi:3-methyladenine DNA glycosylase AlkD